MAAQAVSMNRLRDGVTGGFRVSEIKSFNTEIEVQNPNTGMIETATWTKLQVKLTHDASQPMSQKDPYAVANVDPARPLVLTLHTFLIPGPDGPRPADKAPSSDRMRWAFIKYDVFQKILHFGGYIPKSKPPQRFPLPGVVFITCALSGGNNYPRKIGGPEIIEEAAAAQAEMVDCLDAIFSMGGAQPEGDTSASLDALTEIPTAETEPKGKKDKKAS